MKNPHGWITLVIAIIYIILGLLHWPSEVTRGMTRPGVYEQKGIYLNEVPQSYDSWTEQLKRKKERGR